MPRTINAESFVIKNILKIDRYKVPFYQRGFSWEKDQVEQFWDDISQMVESNNELESINEYFIGAMVFSYEN